MTSHITMHDRSELHCFGMCLYIYSGFTLSFTLSYCTLVFVLVFYLPDFAWFFAACIVTFALVYISCSQLTCAHESRLRTCSDYFYTFGCHIACSKSMAMWNYCLMRAVQLREVLTRSHMVSTAWVTRLFQFFHSHDGSNLLTFGYFGLLQHIFVSVLSVHHLTDFPRNLFVSIQFIN